MSACEEFNAVHKWTDEILGQIKRKKLSRDMGWYWHLLTCLHI